MNDRIHVRCLLAGVALIALTAGARADDAELETDRPDRTEGVVPVPRGDWQIEFDLASWARYEVEGVPGTNQAVDVGAFNLKYGISHRADLQFVMTPWSRIRHERPGEETTVERGNGEMSGRLKL